MNADQLLQIQNSIKVQINESVAIAIKANVNGKIDALKLKVDEYIKDDNAWKLQAQPVIDIGQDGMTFAKVVAYLAATLLGVFSLIKLFFFVKKL